MTHYHQSALSEHQTADAMRRRAAAHYAVLEANFLTRGLYAGDPENDRLVRALDEAVAALAVGKWYLGRVTGDLAGLSKRSNDLADFTRSALAFEDATRIAQAAAAGKPVSLERSYRPRGRAGTEILWAQDIPIVPSVAPIVVLQGSSRAMGVQYMRQVVGIFGSFVFSGFASRGLSGDQKQIIDRWAEHMQRETPSTVEFAIGMSEGARACGIDMSPHEALAMWTGIEAPPRQVSGMQGLAYFGVVEDIPDPCSGACAWGGGTKDGELYLASSTDHDCTFQATIVAYPDEGNSYIYTPFSVNGYTTFVGQAWFAGHPGINSKGLAYVQHGAGCEGSSRAQHWDYGVRRGASTFEILQHHSNARDAMEKELFLPLGDGASVLGTAGGFYADRDFGYVIESREPSNGPVIRYHTMDANGRKLDALYANNNNIDPRSGSHFSPPSTGYQYELEAGWFTLQEPDMADNFGIVSRRMLTKSSESRNRYFHRQLTEHYGSFDIAGMAELYRQGPKFPDKPWSEIEAAWKRGERFEGSPAQRGNAFVAVASPRDDGTGVYKGCVGPITHRSVAPHKAGHGYIYHDETNELWELTLAHSPQEVLRLATASAQARIEQADMQVRDADPTQRSTLNGFVEEARTRLAGNSTASRDNDLDSLARTLRQVTRAQVRAAQAVTAATRGKTRGS
jgi:hypothetical protein